MVFRTRNCYYLRISEKTVLPLYLYLDARHLDWMSDVVLQHVLSDLRPWLVVSNKLCSATAANALQSILVKLQAESEVGLQHGGSASAAAKKAAASTVDTHRGDTYQFCYFIRNVEPHSVLIKARRFVAAPPRTVVVPPPPPPASSRPRGAKRKAAPAAAKSTTKEAPRKKLRTRKKQNYAEDAMDETEDDESDIYVSDTDDEIEMQGEDDIEEDTGGGQSNGKNVFDIEVEEEEKPKPILHLQYQGFGIYGKCLCVVVEPWPIAVSDKPTKKETLALAPEKSRLTSVQSQKIQQPTRGETPLFLPDDTDVPELPDVLLYTMDEDESDEDDDPFSNVMAFSQALAKAGDNRPGAADDDEDMDAAVLFGDADEARDL